MKKTLPLLPLAIIVVAVIGIFGCDKIDENDIIKEGVVETHGRKILILDFTAHQCRYCPKGHRAITSLCELYDTLIVPVAVHCSEKADRVPNNAAFDHDYHTPVGDTMASDFNFDLPSGLVNTFDGEKVTGPDKWATQVATMIGSFPEVNIHTTATFAATDSLITVQNTVTANFEHSYNLVLVNYLTEDGIISGQVDAEHQPPAILQYEHNHVLRAGLNGSYGTAIAAVQPNDKVKKAYTIKLQPDWNKARCHIVTFVYDKDSKSVLQAEIADIQ